MKPYDKVSSFRGVNTYFRGGRIKAEQRRKNRQIKRQHREERTQKADQQGDKSSRSKEGPTQIREDEITGDQRIRAEEPGPL
jgi:hypothetical protein